VKYTGSMKAFSTGVVLSLFASFSAWSQIGIPVPAPQPLTQVRQFLGLTDTQVSAILRNNNDYNSFYFQQQQQIQKAQAQIAVETAKDVIDPMALGTLYAGIESACRELRDRVASSQKQNLAILTDAQKAKLNTLNDALKLAPVISEAQSGNLLGSGGFFFTSSAGGVLLGITSSPAILGCGGASPVFRNGDFSSLIPAEAAPRPNPWFDVTPQK
jgi:hypothetical protein